MYSWIEDILQGIDESYDTNNIYDLYDIFGIEIRKLDKNNILLRGNESFYCRNFLDKEIVFIRNDLNIYLEKFILSHELGHAVLHINVYEAAFNKLINIGKLEKQANYFAIRILKIKFDEVILREMSLEQISSCLKIPYEPLKQLVAL